MGADGLTARIVRDAAAGYVAPAEEPPDLAHAIDVCRQDPDRDLRGASGRAYVKEHYARTAILDRLAEILRLAALEN